MSLVLQVVQQVYLKPERLTKRSSSNDLQLKIRIIYDYSVDRSVKAARRASAGLIPNSPVGSGLVSEQTIGCFLDGVM